MRTKSAITDAQIRALMQEVKADVGSHPAFSDREARSVLRLCKIALNDAPTYLKASVVRDARERLAVIITRPGVRAARAVIGALGGKR